MKKTEPIFVRKGKQEIVLQEKRVAELTSKYLEECAKDANLSDDFGMKVKVVNMLIDMKKTWWPATNKNLNVNVDTFDKQLELWLQTREKLKEEEVDVEAVYEIQ